MTCSTRRKGSNDIMRVSAKYKDLPERITIELSGDEAKSLVGFIDGIIKSGMEPKTHPLANFMLGLSSHIYDSFREREEV